MPLSGDKFIKINEERAKDVINEERVRDVLRKVDAEGDGDGRLNKEELKVALRQLGSRNAAWRYRRCLSHADDNKDGLVSEKEQEELVKYLVAKYGN
ncbi:putative Calcium-binding EF-hand family protein [Quillaja saponaria]|uniref:Calcium-binding EF-hand family protein n=1 Tax=Quillaja saponaria TaxID=32244 RepID=A0AAD7KN80_QUISA|nr:putative Calcium-binding EF-hand family protein [Quillaja saponaria]